ncbi:hypothetical protein [Streptomyces sp. UG1]|uniref:hypothetical protein n=1 Tax=Streptomyces sp. UG1 TaxID=3417652 RepID=UPI003CEB9AE1
MTAVAETPTGALPDHEPAPRMWMGGYRMSPDGRRRVILPRTDVDDMLEQGGLGISTELPPCRCPQQRRQT